MLACSIVVRAPSWTDPTEPYESGKKDVWGMGWRQFWKTEIGRILLRAAHGCFRESAACC